MAKTFVLSDENVNNYGYWVKTDGIDLSQFKKNPIMLWMHNRAFSGKKDEVLPIGYWDNVRVENAQLLADAIFDLNDPFAKSISDKVDANVLRMASCYFQPLATDDSRAVLKDGQTRPTVLKSKLKEASIVDIAGNDNSVALCDEAGNVYQLNDDTKPFPLPLLELKSENKMSKELNTLLKLVDGASESDRMEAIKLMQTNLTEKDNKIAELTGKVNDYEAKEQTARKASVGVMLADAAKDGRIDATTVKDWEQQFDKDFEGTKLVLDKLPKRQSVANRLKDGDREENDEAKYMKLSWSELDKGKHMQDVKDNYPEIYKLKFKEKFGFEPKL